jgi:hypothetical protein
VTEVVLYSWFLWQQKFYILRDLWQKWFYIRGSRGNRSSICFVTCDRISSIFVVLVVAEVLYSPWLVAAKFLCFWRIVVAKRAVLKIIRRNCSSKLQLNQYHLLRPSSNNITKRRRQLHRSLTSAAWYSEGSGYESRETHYLD